MRRSLPFASLVVVACVESSAVGTSSQTVIGGTPTPEGEFPGVVGLVYSFGGQSAVGCTGTLIAPDVVLTAAHCLDPEVTGVARPSAITFDHDARGATTNLPVASALKHPSFDINVGGIGGLEQFFDIGLVFLAQPVTDRAPVRMPTVELATALAIDTELAIVGYGQTSDANPDSTGVKYDAVTSIRELNATEMRVSSGTPDPQNCHGDSGGPALATFDGEQRVVGVVSRSYQSGQCDNGGIDTRVDAYLEWIFAAAPNAAFPCGSGNAPACDDDGGGDDGGCCSTGGGAPGASLALGAGVALVIARRRRR